MWYIIFYQIQRAETAQPLFHLLILVKLTLTLIWSFRFIQNWHFHNFSKISKSLENLSKNLKSSPNPSKKISNFFNLSFVFAQKLWIRTEKGTIVKTCGLCSNAADSRKLQGRWIRRQYRQERGNSRARIRCLRTGRLALDLLSTVQMFE